MSRKSELQAEARRIEAEEKYQKGYDPGTHWRVGSKVGRTIYAMTKHLKEPFATLPHDKHPLIGVMDTPELAAEAVRAHNTDIEIRSSR